MFRQKTFVILLGLGIGVFGSSCLKTRAQLKNEGGGNSVRSVGSDTNNNSLVLDEIKIEITRLNGRIDELERENRNLKNTQGNEKKADIDKLETRIISIERSQMDILAEIRSLQRKMPVPNKVSVFNMGKENFKAGSYNSAVKKFTSYLNSPKAKFREEATFLRAESYYKLKKYKKAIRDYSQFPEKFHRSKFNKKALFKIGMSFDSMGYRDDAKAFYQELIEKFPKSREAKDAKRKLASRKKIKKSKKKK